MALYMRKTKKTRLQYGSDHLLKRSCNLLLALAERYNLRLLHVIKVSAMDNLICLSPPVVSVLLDRKAAVVQQLDEWLGKTESFPTRLFVGLQEHWHELSSLDDPH